MVLRAHTAPSVPFSSGGTMNPDKPVPISADGLRKLEVELQELRTGKRKEVADRIHAAMEFGDYSENSELEQAKNDQAFLEGRILTLEQMVKNAVVIDERDHHDIVEIGSQVTIEANGDKEQYVIVGSAEAAPAEGRISNESPIGKALIGHKKGDLVRASVPRGEVELKILAIR